MSTRIIEIVCPDTTLPDLYNQSIPEDCPNAYGHCGLLVDFDFFCRGIHLFPREIAMESRRSGALWQPISLEHHRSGPLDSD